MIVARPAFRAAGHERVEREGAYGTMATGHIVQVQGPVVDLGFAAGELPAIYNAVTIKNLSANMQSSGALNVSLQNGRVDDFKNLRNLNLALDLQYDLAKLWPIVHPMLIKPGEEEHQSLNSRFVGRVSGE